MDLSGFRDPELARGLIDAIHGSDPGRPIKLMEVCGTHTVSIAKNGLRGVMPEWLTLLSGPGCPVCVTANHDIDTAIAISQVPDVIVTTFGDMMKVPGSYSSLTREKSEGRDIRIVYSPLDALELAKREPDKQVVFIAVGFETTVPLIAASIMRAQEAGIENFSIYCSHKTVPAALGALVNDPEVKVDAFILPGHVSTIIGMEPYRFLAEEYHVPGVIAGFEPIDMLQGIWMLVKQLKEGRAEIEIAYMRGVEPQGNPTALAMVEKVFEPVDADWRGIGVIPGTGLALREEYAAWDASKRFDLEIPEPKEIKGCQCGDVLRGIVLPFQCKLFGRGCTPEHPIGPCMVSSEGSCAAYYRYTDYGREEA
ncbi:MAG TPA: hydrogenase formation protein HypD [Coriobacteriia bacterium]|nr:hydrogenase formation protein HypD [Coriobacteriia bacterium]